MSLQLKIRCKIEVELQLLFDLILKARTSSNNKSIMILMCVQILGNVFGATDQTIFQIIAQTDDKEEQVLEENIYESAEFAEGDVGKEVTCIIQ